MALLVGIVPVLDWTLRPSAIGRSMVDRGGSMRSRSPHVSEVLCQEFLTLIARKGYDLTKIVKTLQPRGDGRGVRVSSFTGAESQRRSHPPAGRIPAAAP